MPVKGGFAVQKGIELLKQAQVVILDVDSTIIRKEGVDMLASYLGKEREIAACKQEIINGLIPYNEFTHKCLNLLKPSKQVCEGCLQSYPYELVDYIQEFISACKEKKKEVFLVSGGFVPMITPLLRILHIDESHLFAIPLQFDSEGRFLGFDETATVTRLDGKGIIAKELREKETNGSGVVVNIGDGILDANAYPNTDAFIGFTGVTYKPRAMEKAMLIVDSFSDLTEMVRNS